MAITGATTWRSSSVTPARAIPSTRAASDSSGDAAAQRDATRPASAAGTASLGSASSRVIQRAICRVCSRQVGHVSRWSSIDRRSSGGSARATHPASRSGSTQSTAGGAPAVRRIDRHRGTRGRHRPLQAVQATAACGAAVDVDPDRFRFRGRKLSVEELRQEYRIGAGHGAASWPGLIRRSSRSRRRKIREQTVPTVEFRRRAMSL